MRLTKLAGAVMALLLAGTSAPLAGGAADPEKSVKPEWAGNRLGYEALSPDYVDVDYGPMSISGRTAMSLFKKMTLAKSGLPESISVKGMQVLSGPAKLILEDEKGIIPFSVNDCQLRSTGRSAAEGLSRFDAGGMTVEVKSHFDFDFTVRYQITLTPKSKAPVVLKKAGLVFPVKLEGEKLCHYYRERPNKPMAGVDAQKYRVYKTIRDGDYEQIMPGFCPTFWVGNTEYGLSWNFESARGWNPVKGTELQFDPGTGRMMINFINKVTTLEKPVTYSFLLTPTPLKNMPKNWRAWSYHWRGSTTQKIDRKLSNQLIYWSSIWRGGGYNPHWIRNPEDLKKAAREDAGMNKANYIIPQLNTPKMIWRTEDGKTYVLEDKYLRMLCEKYTNSTSGKESIYSAKEGNLPADTYYFKSIEERNRVLGAIPESRLKSDAITYDVVSSPEMADHMVWAVNKFVNEYGVGGIYYDGISPVQNYGDWSAWSDTYGGWTDPEGALRPSWHFEWQRQLLKRNRHIVRTADPNEMIWAHQSGTRSASTLALCDGIIPGETLYYWYHDPEKRDASANGDFYYAHIVGDIDNLKGEFFHRQWGVPHMLLPEVRGKDSKIFAQPKKGTRTMLAYFLHFDTLYWPTMCDVQEIFNWDRIKDAWGMADTAEARVEFIPYWENKAFKADDKSVKVSFYEKVRSKAGDKAVNYLVIASNLQFGTADFNISLPAGLEKAVIREMQSKKEILPADGRIACSLEPYDFAVFEVSGELDKGKIAAAAAAAAAKAADAREKAEKAIVKPVWAGNKLGYEAFHPDYVDVDYGPLTVNGQTAASLFKRITLAPSGLPGAISVKDMKVVSAPVELLLEGARGPLSLKGGGVKLKQTGKSAAEGVSRFDAGDMTVEIKSQFEFDFTVRYLVTLAPKANKRATLKRMSLVFPMNLQGEKLCHYYQERPDRLMSAEDSQKLRVYKTIKADDRDLIAPGFCDTFWVGNTNYGLGLAFESARGWNPVKGSELLFDPGTGRMTINFINRQTGLDKPITYKFFMTPTPLKNMPKNWRAWNYDWRGSTDQKIDRNRTNQLIYWPSIWRGGHYNPQWVRNPEELKRTAAADAGMNKANYIIPQLNSWQVTSETSDGKFYVMEDKYLRKLCEKYLAVPGWKGKETEIPEGAVYFKNMEERNSVLGTAIVPNARVKDKAITYSVVSSPEMADHMVWAVNKFVNEYGVGGIYYDGISPVHNYNDWSAWSKTYGGWTDADGDRRPSWHYEWQRQLLKRNRYIVKKADPHEMITAHQSGARSAATLALCDVIIPGETLFYWYHAPEKRDASANGDFYYAHIIGDIDNLKGEFFHRQWGVPHILIPELRGKDSRVFPNPTRGTRTMLAYFLHFDTLYWPNSCDTAQIYDWNRIKTDYGMADTAEARVEFIPYWENKAFKADDKSVRISYYNKIRSKPGDKAVRYLVIVSNLQLGDADFTFSLPAGLQKSRIREVQEKKDIVATGGRIACSLKAYDYAIYEISGERMQ